MASDVAGLDGKMADTALAGKQIGIKVDMGNVYLNDNVKVVSTDIEASNGVIHVIDAVSSCRLRTKLLWEPKISLTRPLLTDALPL